jgi:hypothetical protein
MSSNDSMNQASPMKSFWKSIREEIRQLPALQSSQTRQRIANDEKDHERQSSKAAEKQRREDEYERLNLKEKVVHGVGSPMRIA